jgi:hypothetical protein
MAKAKQHGKHYTVLDIDKPLLFAKVPWTLVRSAIFRSADGGWKSSLFWLLVAIDGLARNNKREPGWCTARNQYFAELMGVSVVTVSNNVSELVSLGLVESEGGESRRRKLRLTPAIKYAMDLHSGALRPEDVLDDNGISALLRTLKRALRLNDRTLKPALRLLLKPLSGLYAYREIKSKEKTKRDRETRNSISTAAQSLGQGLTGKTPTREKILDGKTSPARPNSQPRDGAQAPERPGKANSNLTRSQDEHRVVTKLFEAYVRKNVTGGGELSEKQLSQCIMASKKLHQIAEKEGWLDYAENPKLPTMVDGSVEENLRYWANCYCDFITNKQFKGAVLSAGHFIPKPERVGVFSKWLRRENSTAGEEAEKEPKPTVQQQQKKRPPMTEKQRDIESRRYRVRE